MSDILFVIIVLFFTFISGFGWGEMYAERTIRKQNDELNRGRMSVSVPTNPETASKVMLLLGDLIRQVEEEQIRVEQ